MNMFIENLNESFENFNFLVAFLIFFSYIVIDALTAKYTIDTANLNEYKSANSSVMIYILTAYGIINYTQNWLYIFPLVIGAWIGTFLMIKITKNKKEK